MFGKLIKLELNYLVRKFLPIWSLALVVAVLNFAVGMGRADFMFFSDHMMVVALVLFIGMVVLVVVLSAMAFIQTCLRFYRSMFGGEGYLTHTLPVSVDALLWSKGLSAMVMLLIMEVFALLMVAVMMLMAHHTLGDEMSEVFEVIEMLGITGADMVKYGLLALVYGLISSMASIFMVYASIAVGHLWREHPVGGGILAYIALSAIMSALSSLINRIAMLLPFYSEAMDAIYTVEDMTVTFSAISAVTAASVVLMGVACYFLTRYLVKNKLNLQ